MAFSLVNVALHGVKSAGVPIDALLLPMFLVLAIVAARLAKGEPLLGSHKLATRELLELHGGTAGKGRLRSTLQTTIGGTTGEVAFRLGAGGLVITLKPDPPLDRRISIHGHAPEDQPARVMGERFPGTASDALLRGVVRGPAEALAPALSHQLRDALDSAIPTYRLRVFDGELRAVVPLTWKSPRITLAVEELFDLARGLAVPPDDVPAHLLAVVYDDPDPGFRRRAAEVLLELHGPSAEAQIARRELLEDRDAELVLLAAACHEEGAEDALRRLVREANAAIVDAALDALQQIGVNADVRVAALSHRLRDRLAGLERELPRSLWATLAERGDAEELVLLRSAVDGGQLDRSDQGAAERTLRALRGRLEAAGAGGALAVAEEPGGLALTDEGGTLALAGTDRPVKKARA